MISPSSSKASVIASRSGSANRSAHAARSVGRVGSHSPTSGRLRMSNMASASSAVAGRMASRSVCTGQRTALRSWGIQAPFLSC